jgi:hypothetical protein
MCVILIWRLIDVLGDRADRWLKAQLEFWRHFRGFAENNVAIFILHHNIGIETVLVGVSLWDPGTRWSVGHFGGKSCQWRAIRFRRGVSARILVRIRRYRNHL